jgi:hypothetical protein
MPFYFDASMYSYTKWFYLPLNLFTFASLKVKNVPVEATVIVIPDLNSPDKEDLLTLNTISGFLVNQDKNINNRRIV